MSPLALASTVPDALSLTAALVCGLLAWRLRRARDEQARRGAFLTAALEQMRDRVVLCDPRGAVLLATGDRAHDPAALDLYELDGATPLDPGALPLRRALAGERVDGFEVVARVPGAEGDRRLLLHAAPAVGADGRVLGAVASAADITDAREAELRLAEANLVLRAVRDATRDLREDGDVAHAICQGARFASGASRVLLYQPDGDGHLVATGAAGGDGGLPQRLPAAGDAAVARVFATGRSHFTAGPACALLEPVLRGGRAVAVLVAGWREPLRSPSEPAAMSIGLLADEAAGALERAELIAELRDLSRRDPLTGLSNRRAWDEELGRELSRARRAGHPLCVALLDLDHFKSYNDELGHQAGDWLLRTAAADWAAALRDSDVLARWGGEEFAVCLPNCSPIEAELVLGRLRALIPDRQTCSVGLAQWDGAETPAELLRRTDRALYEAKGAGRDRLVAAC